MVKTPEELALWRRAHGVTDYEVKMATDLWINDILYSELNLAGGAAHRGVRSAVTIWSGTVSTSTWSPPRKCSGGCPESL